MPGFYDNNYLKLIMIRTDYQIKLMFNSYLNRCGVLSYNMPNNTNLVSQHKGFLYTINKFFN